MAFRCACALNAEWVCDTRVVPVVQRSSKMSHAAPYDGDAGLSRSFPCFGGRVSYPRELGRLFSLRAQEKLASSWLSACHNMDPLLMPSLRPGQSRPNSASSNYSRPEPRASEPGPGCPKLQLHRSRVARSLTVGSTLHPHMAYTYTCLHQFTPAARALLLEMLSTSSCSALETRPSSGLNHNDGHLCECFAKPDNCIFAAMQLDESCDTQP